MKQQIKKWTLRLTMTGLLITVLLLAIVLNPILTYANKTTHNSFTVYHNKQIDPSLTSTLDQAARLLQISEFYSSNLKLDFCLNDGSKYPTIIKMLRGQAFAWGFYDKIVMQGTMNCKENYLELNGYKWNLTQLLAHEMTHCLQFEKLGFWKSKPVADIPNWKWEGYAEYISRQCNNQKDLVKNIERFEETDKYLWDITFEDNTIAPREYYNYWTLVQYCLDIKQMTYQQLLSDTTSELAIQTELAKWYCKKKSESTTSIWQ